MTIPAHAVEDPAALDAAAGRLAAGSRALLDQLLLMVPVGEPIPERMRDRVVRDGGPLFQAALLLPRASPDREGSVHPQHYAGACRLNPGAKGIALTNPAPQAEAVPSFPPADARWDAVVVAAQLEQTPGGLTQDGAIRRDVERRLLTGLGNDELRWGLALRLARAAGLVRASSGRLVGLPEATPRPVVDPAQLADEPIVATVCGLILRLSKTEWTDVRWLIATLAGVARETFFSPLRGIYLGRTESFDDAGFADIELPALRKALDLLHRVGAIDAARDAEGVSAFRLPTQRQPTDGKFMVTPDGGVLVHVAEARLSDYGRLCRLAPFVDGDALRRHHLNRDGAAAELGAGHRDTHEFLTERSRTGLPGNVGDQLREWQRSATRITVISGVDIVEEDSGKFRVATPADVGRSIDYTTRPRARFFSEGGRLLVPEMWDPLDLRATLARIGTYQGREGGTHIFLSELRQHKQPASLLARLRDYFGGELPGEVETLILAGAGLQPVTVETAAILRLPALAASALKRDRLLGPLLRRQLSADECVVDVADLPTIQARLMALGLAIRE